MIHADFLTLADGRLVGFHISGHSGSGDEGTDIICAAVSSAAYLTANAVTDVLRLPARICVDDGEMHVRVEEKEASACRDFFAAFKLHMKALEEQYPQNIDVNYLEV